MTNTERAEFIIAGLIDRCHLPYLHRLEFVTQTLDAVVKEKDDENLRLRTAIQKVLAHEEVFGKLPPYLIDELQAALTPKGEPQ